MMRKADRLCAMVALMSGAIFVSTLVAVPAMGQTASMARVSLVADDPDMVGDIFVELSDDGQSFTVTGLVGAVPGGSTVARVGLTGLPIGGQTAGRTGVFPAPGGSDIVYSYDPSRTHELEVTPSGGSPFRASFTVNFSEATTPAHRLVDIVPDDPDSLPAGVTLGKVLITQREDLDEFEGLPGAVPEFSSIDVFSRPRSDDEHVWTDYRIWTTIAVDYYGTGTYASMGRILPWTTLDLNSSRTTIPAGGGKLERYPESKLYLRITTPSGEVIRASIQNDVTVDVGASLEEINAAVVNNNTRNADGSFPLTPPVVGYIQAPSGTVESFASVIVYKEVDGERITFGTADVDPTGAVSLNLIANAAASVDNQDLVSLEDVTLRLEDLFGNVLEVPGLVIDTSANIFEGPTVTTAADNADLIDEGLIARVTGVVEPGSLLVVRADEVGGVEAPADSRFLLDVVQADDDGNFTFDVGSSPVIYIDLIDLAGNVEVLAPLTIDDSAPAPGDVNLTVTAAEDDADLAEERVNGHVVFARVQGTVEPRSVLEIRADEVGGVSEGGPFLLDTVQAAKDGAVAFDILDVSAAAVINITMIDRAGNRTVLDPLTLDDSADAPTVTADNVKIGFPSSEISGTAEANGSIAVIGLFSVTSDILSSAQTGEVVASLPAGVDSGLLGEASVDSDGNFTLNVPGFASQVVYLQTRDLADNRSQYTTVVLGHAITGQHLLNFTGTSFSNNPPGYPDVLDFTVLDARTGDPVPDVELVAYADFSMEDGAFINPVTDPDFPSISMADGTLDYPLEIPDFKPTAVNMTTENVLTEFYVVAQTTDPVTGNPDYIAAAKYDETTVFDDGTAFDRRGPQIKSIVPLIFQDYDLQLFEYGSEAADTLNVLNLLPSTASAGPRLPGDAMNFVLVIADDNDDKSIDVWDLSTLQLLDVKPLNALIGAPYGVPSLPIPGCSGLNLGHNFWNPRTQSVSGHSTVFLAIMDRFGNLSEDAVPVTLDVSTPDPDTSRISVGDGVIYGEDGAVEPLANIAFYGDTALTDLLASGTADSVGAFAAEVDTTRGALVVVSRDAAGNKSNPVNIQAAPAAKGVPYLVLDGLGAIHSPGGTLVGSAVSKDMARSLAEAGDAPGMFYQLNADGEIVGPLGGVSGPGVESDEQISFSRNIARDFEVIAAKGSVSGYILAGNGFVGTIGDAPFLGDAVRDALADTNNRVTPGNERVRLDGTIYLEDSNGNGEYDIFQFETEDLNGNGVLDPETVEFVPVDPDDPSQGVEEVVIPAEDVNGNGVLDVIFDAEGLFDASDKGIGFTGDVARDLEIVYGPEPESPTAVPNVSGYMILDGFGVLHGYGSSPGLQNPRTSPGNDIFRAFELVVDADGNVQDFVVLNGLGQMYATPGGFLNAPTEDADIPGGGGDLSLVLDPKPVFFGFDIARDVEVNPIDSNDDGVIGDGSDGFYVLDGYGGVHAVGNAPAVTNSPFLGFDIARDLVISKSVGTSITVPAE